MARKMSAKKRATWTALAGHLRKAAEEGATEALCLTLADTIEKSLAAKDEKAIQTALETWAAGEGRLAN